MDKLQGVLRNIVKIGDTLELVQGAAGANDYIIIVRPDAPAGSREQVQKLPANALPLNTSELTNLEVGKSYTDYGAPSLSAATPLTILTLADPGRFAAGVVYDVDLRFAILDPDPATDTMTVTIGATTFTFAPSAQSAPFIHITGKLMAEEGESTVNFLGTQVNGAGTVVGDSFAHYKGSVASTGANSILFQLTSSAGANVIEFSYAVTKVYDPNGIYLGL